MAAKLSTPLMSATDDPFYLFKEYVAVGGMIALQRTAPRPANPAQHRFPKRDQVQDPAGQVEVPVACHKHCHQCGVP